MPPRTSLSHCLSLLNQVVPQDLPTLTQELPGELIEQALAATGTATVRRRRLPAEQIVWLVLGMVLFRHLNIVQVVDQLGLAVQKPNSRRPVVPSAIHKARERLDRCRWPGSSAPPPRVGRTKARPNTSSADCPFTEWMERPCGSPTQAKTASTSAAPRPPGAKVGIRYAAWRR